MLLAALLGLTTNWHYADLKMEGWTVRVADAVVADAKTWNAGKQELQRQLQAIARVAPDAPLAQIRRVTIYVTATHSGCAAYHPSAAWLTEHKLDPAMATNIEIGNVSDFVSWTYEQPWMVLHELAHAYMFRVLDKCSLGEDVQKDFDAAVISKRYERVLTWNGSYSKHYALNNKMEFFAEMSEAYFGTNDFFPFVRAELQTYDPDTFALMERTWGKPAKRNAVDAGTEGFGTTSSSASAPTSENDPDQESLRPRFGAGWTKNPRRQALAALCQ